jgi:hypothetical protein
LRRSGRKIQDQAFAIFGVTLNVQITACRTETDILQRRIDRAEHHVRRRQRAVAAKIHLTMGSKPTNGRHIAIVPDEAGFRQAQLIGDRLHLGGRQRLFQQAYAGRIAAKPFAGEGHYVEVIFCHLQLLNAR